jgi:hypothetical protein
MRSCCSQSRSVVIYRTHPLDVVASEFSTDRFSDTQNARINGLICISAIIVRRLCDLVFKSLFLIHGGDTFR